MSTVGVSAVSPNVKVYGVTPHWTFSIMHVDGYNADIIYHDHLVNSASKLLSTGEDKRYSDIFSRVLEGILRNRDSYLIEKVNAFNIEIGPCIIRKFTFEPHYVVPLKGLELPFSGTYSASSISTMIKETVEFGKVHVVYHSEFHDLYFQEITAQQGHSYVERHPRSWVKLIEKDVEEAGTSSKSKVKQLAEKMSISLK